MSTRQRYVGWCVKHEKQSYATRRDARAVERVHRGEAMRAYRCDAVAGYWHIGHLPQAVREGRITDTEFYDQKRSTS